MSKRYISSDGRFTPYMRRRAVIEGTPMRIEVRGADGEWHDLGTSRLFTVQWSAIADAADWLSTHRIDEDAPADPDPLPAEGEAWRVAWVNHDTGDEGIGERRLTRAQAEAWVEAMDAERPRITHWAVKAL